MVELHEDIIEKLILMPLYMLFFDNTVKSLNMAIVNFMALTAFFNEIMSGSVNGFLERIKVETFLAVTIAIFLAGSATPKSSRVAVARLTILPVSPRLAELY